jgi:hypothetical protein
MMPKSLLESFAWRALSRAARQVVDRIAIEHLAHAGMENGKLRVQKTDFIDYGIHNDAIAPAQREALALGLILMTKRGRAGNAEHRAPHHWALAFVRKDPRYTAMVSTRWKRFQSLKEAKAVGDEARASKDTTAVAMGRKRAAKAKRGKLIHFPVPETRTDFGPGNQDRVRSRKPGL